MTWFEREGVNLGWESARVTPARGERYFSVTRLQVFFIEMTRHIELVKRFLRHSRISTIW